MKEAVEVVEIVKFINQQSLNNDQSILDASDFYVFKLFY